MTLSFSTMVVSMEKIFTLVALKFSSCVKNGGFSCPGTIASPMSKSISNGVPDGCNLSHNRGNNTGIFSCNRNGCNTFHFNWIMLKAKKGDCFFTQCLSIVCQFNFLLRNGVSYAMMVIVKKII